MLNAPLSFKLSFYVLIEAVMRDIVKSHLLNLKAYFCISKDLCLKVILAIIAF